MQYERLVDNSKNFIICGGVAANNYLRYKLKNLSKDLRYNFVAPPAKLCTDNGVMVAFSGLQRLKKAIINDMSFVPKARWNLEKI